MYTVMIRLNDILKMTIESLRYNKYGLIIYIKRSWESHSAGYKKLNYVNRIIAYRQ